MSRDGVVDCITAHVPQLDCWVRDTMREHFVEYNNQLYTWLNKTRRWRTYVDHGPARWADVVRAVGIAAA